MIVPVSWFYLFLLYTTFNSLKNALGAGHRAVCAHRRHLPLVLTGTNFSISAAVGVSRRWEWRSSRSPVNLSYRGFRRSGVELREPSSKGRMCRCVPYSWRRWPPPSMLRPLATGIGSQAQSLLRACGGGDAHRGGVDSRGASVLYEYPSSHGQPATVDAEREARSPILQLSRGYLILYVHSSVSPVLVSVWYWSLLRDAGQTWLPLWSGRCRCPMRRAKIRAGSDVSVAPNTKALTPEETATGGGTPAAVGRQQGFGRWKFVHLGDRSCRSSQGVTMPGPRIRYTPSRPSDD